MCSFRETASHYGIKQAQNPDLGICKKTYKRNDKTLRMNRSQPWTENRKYVLSRDQLIQTEGEKIIHKKTGKSGFLNYNT